MFQVCLDQSIHVTINDEEHSEFEWLTLKEALKRPLIRGEDECIYLVYGKDLSLVPTAVPKECIPYRDLSR